MASISPTLTEAAVFQQQRTDWSRNPFVRFFLWASKTDTRLMRLCAGSTRRTHVARGFFVLGTGVASAAASFYFLYATIGSVKAAAFIAPLCGSLIFMFDRELVGGSTIRAAWVRILLSLVLGIIIATPFEMRLLQNRIDKELEHQQQLQNRPALLAAQQQQAQIDAREVEFQNQIADLRRQQQTAIRNKEAEVAGAHIDGETTGVKGVGPAYHAAEDRVRDLQGQIDAITQQIASLDAARNRAETEYQHQQINALYDFPSRYEAMEKFVPRYSPLWRLSWMITAVIVLFDMFPVMSKFLGNETDYDFLQRTEMAEIIHRVRTVSDQNFAAVQNGSTAWHPSTIDALEKLARQQRDIGMERGPAA